MGAATERGPVAPGRGPAGARAGRRRSAPPGSPGPASGTLGGVHRDDPAPGPLRLPGDDAPFRARVVAWVAAVPPGRVATYGQIAALAGSPLAARQVGMVLRGLDPAVDGPVPWQRIVNAAGGISTDKIGGGALQRRLLREEGIRFGSDGRLDLGRYRWDPGDPGGAARSDGSDDGA